MREKACRAFGITLEKFFTGEKQVLEMSAEEAVLISILKELSERERLFVKDILDFTDKWLQKNP